MPPKKSTTAKKPAKGAVAESASVTSSASTAPQKPGGGQHGWKHFFDSWTFIILVCVVLPLAFRSFFYAPFHIPSGSMKSTLLDGDYIFVNKAAYGYSRYSFPFGLPLFKGRTSEVGPQRGDVVVFRPAHLPQIDFIKRVVGLPGDTIQVKGGVLYLNGKALPRRRTSDFEEAESDGNVRRYVRYIETIPRDNNSTETLSYSTLDEFAQGDLDNTGIFTVPAGHYFMMGDNRDNSQDSRVQEVVGYVPAEHLVGRAERVFISTEVPLWEFWQWPGHFRWQRYWLSIAQEPKVEK